MLSALLIAITVLTWNTGRMGEFKKPEKNEVLQYLLQQDADVVCLQEVDVYKDVHFLTLPDVKKTLSPKYPYSYLDFSVFNKRHQYGTMVWSKYPLIHKQSIHYESFGNLSNRCDIVVGKDTFRLFNNHLESYKLESEDLQDVNKIEQKWKRAVPLRNKQAQVVRAEIDESPYPVIVVGDFNSPILSYTYWCLSSGLHDAWSEVGSGYAYTYNSHHLFYRIDHVLYRGAIKALKAQRYKGGSSDHYPLMVTFDLDVRNNK